MLRCPTCDTPLTPIATADLRLDTCAACGGVWFDRGELESHLASADSRGDVPVGVAPPPRGPAYRRCPSCTQPMTPRNWERYSGVVVDVCNAHGVWVDSGELTRLYLWMDSPRRERTGALDAERARAERRLASAGTDLSPRAGQHVANSWGAFAVEVFGDLVRLFVD